MFIVGLTTCTYFLKHWRVFEVKFSLQVVMNASIKLSDNFFSVCTAEGAYENFGDSKHVTESFPPIR